MQYGHPTSCRQLSMLADMLYVLRTARTWIEGAIAAGCFETVNLGG